jgi:hypothetical protein
MKETGSPRRIVEEAIRLSIESSEINERKEGRCKILYV